MQQVQQPEIVLSERKERILKALVEDYIRTATPVASEALAREHGLGVSSATIRNELAELEADGFIHQPHTSAGRIPTERGYRYFVQRLMQEQRISRHEQLTIRHQFHQVALFREQWLQLAAAVLARGVRAAAIVSAPQVFECHVKHVEALQMQDRLGLVILVLQDGTVKQQLVTLPEQTTQADLSHACNRLNAFLPGKSRREVVADADRERFTTTEHFVLTSALQVMEQLDDRSLANVYHDGLIELLDQPEFRRGPAERLMERARAIVEVLERPQMLREVLPAVPHGGGVQVLIGSENRWDWMRECAVVLARYGPGAYGTDGGEMTGVVGVLGPLRLAYGVAVPAVRYVSSIMTELLGDPTGASADTSSSTPTETRNGD